MSFFWFLLKALTLLYTLDVAPLGGNRAFVGHWFQQGSNPHLCSGAYSWQTVLVELNENKQHFVFLAMKDHVPQSSLAQSKNVDQALIRTQYNPNLTHADHSGLS